MLALLGVHHILHISRIRVKDTLRPKSNLGNNITGSPRFTQTFPHGARRGDEVRKASSCKRRLSEGVTEAKKTFLYDMREVGREHNKLDWDHGP